RSLYFPVYDPFRGRIFTLTSLSRAWRISDAQSSCGEQTHPQSGGSTGTLKRQIYALVHCSESSAACSNPVCVAFSCVSGGYPYVRRTRFTSSRICARTFSRKVQLNRTRSLWTPSGLR